MRRGFGLVEGECGRRTASRRLVIGLFEGRMDEDGEKRRYFPEERFERNRG